MRRRRHVVEIGIWDHTLVLMLLGLLLMLGTTELLGRNHERQDGAFFETHRLHRRALIVHPENHIPQLDK
jgi:hypothetical protein